MDSKFLNYDNFVNENAKMIDEGTIEGYRYRFTFDGKKYFIDQGKDDETIFGVKDEKKGGWFVMTKGNLFDPTANEMDRNAFVEFLQKGIKFFNIRGEVTPDIIKDSEWAKFFDFELKKKPGRITKKYAVLKLHCGKASAKWLSR